jgi:predicted phage terminase large subunit-like protein
MIPRNGFLLDEHKLIASICRESYFEFFKEFADTFIQEEVVYNWHIKYLCDQLQKIAERVVSKKPNDYDMIVNVPPGMTKSSIFSIAFTPWVWTRMPRARTLAVTHTDLLGKELSTNARRIVYSEKYQKAFPEIELREDQDTKDFWANTDGGWRLACTVAGRTPTGFHAHFLIVDDPIDPQKAGSRQEIKTASEWMKRVLPSRKVDKKVSTTILVMQRLDKDDPAGERLNNVEAGPVKHICLPCDSSWEVKPKALTRRYQKQDGLLDPERLPQNVLKAQLGVMGKFAYAGQYGQSPLPTGGLLFNTEMFEGRILKAVPQNFRRIVRYWDKAYTQDDGCYTVGVKMGVTTDNKFWVLDVVRGQWESSERERMIKLTASLDGLAVKIYVEQEPAAGKESAQNTIRNLAGYRVQADRRGGVNDANKVVRADPLATQVNIGNVYLKEAPWNQPYIEELRYFSEKAKYKDQVDASSGAFNALNKVRKVGSLM